MLAGEPYLAGDPELARERRRAARLIEAFNATPRDRAEESHRILAELLGSLGEGTYIRAPFYCDYGYQTFVGARAFANFGLVALDVAPIRIGDDVQIGPNVQLLTPTHPVEPDARRAGVEGGRPITIGDNVWLGGGVIVCPGVTIGENSVVGAGAVVVKSLPANVLAVGNPARAIRSLKGDAMPAGQEGDEPIYQPNPDDMAGFASHAPYIARALDELPAEQVETLRAAMAARRIVYEEREEGLAVIVDGFELCVVPRAVPESVAYPSSAGGAAEV
ncbi:MAG: maltose O-acetyltransferase [Actinomycetota bacterium]|jgi:maltose O-acetyltransferase|nr:maltose O-acetyltransferase [Actinomycetota bacterium]